MLLNTSHSAQSGPPTWVVPPQVIATDFGTLPPEINSARLFSGPGSEPLRTAAAAWTELAAGLQETVTNYRSATSKLPDAWQGPAALAMTQAVTPYLGWVNALAAQAEQSAVQAKAAASAYESALAATVPPPVIAINRLVRMALAATNFLGQSSPAIADADAEYEKMWARDADAMYAYASASAAAATVTPFTPPPAITPVGLAGQEAAAEEILSTGYQLVSTLPQALEALSSSPFTPFDGNISSVLSSLLKMNSLMVPSSFSTSYASPIGKGLGFARATIGAGARALGSAFSRLDGTGATLSAGVGRGTSIGALSVPHTWATSTMPGPVTPEPQRYGWVCEPAVEDAKGEP